MSSTQDRPLYVWTDPAAPQTPDATTPSNQADPLRRTIVINGARLTISAFWTNAASKPGADGRLYKRALMNLATIAKEDVDTLFDFDEDDL